MGRIVRVLEGRFGRLVLSELASEERLEAPSGFAEVMKSISTLLGPVVARSAEGRWQPSAQRWEQD